MPPVLQRLTSFINLVERIAELTGRAVSWLVLGMVLLIAYDVAMRYLFHIGSVGLQELEWHLFALIFLLGAGYTFKHDGHVRVDIFYHSRHMGRRGRAWVDLLGGLFFLLPFCLLIILSSAPFVANSFGMGEGSPDAGGLAYRFLLKTAIPVGFFLLLLQGVAHMLRSLRTLMADEPDTPSDSPSESLPETLL